MLNIEELGKAYGEFDKSVQAAAVEILLSFLEGQTLFEVLKSIHFHASCGCSRHVRSVDLETIADQCFSLQHFWHWLLHILVYNDPDTKTKRVACFGHRQVKGFVILPLSRCILAGIVRLLATSGIICWLDFGYLGVDSIWPHILYLGNAAQPSLNSVESWWSKIDQSSRCQQLHMFVAIRPLATS